MNAAVEKIFELMKERKLTAKQLSEATGISQSNFTEWKKGRSNPKYEALSLIADYFDVSVDYLLGNDTIRAYDENNNLVVIDDETRSIIDSLRSQPEMKMLFSVTRKATKDDIIKAVKIIEALKETSED